MWMGICACLRLHICVCVTWGGFSLCVCTFYRCETYTSWGGRPKEEVAACSRTAIWSSCTKISVQYTMHRCFIILFHPVQLYVLISNYPCKEENNTYLSQCDAYTYPQHPSYPPNFASLCFVSHHSTSHQVCHLERFSETSGLGISLEARAGHHYLCSILPEGPVGQSGKIFTGDQILEVTEWYWSFQPVALIW